MKKKAKLQTGILIPIKNQKHRAEKASVNNQNLNVFKQEP